MWYVLCVVVPTPEGLAGCQRGPEQGRVSECACGGHECQVTDASLKWDVVAAVHSYSTAEQKWDSCSNSCLFAGVSFWLPSRWWSTASHLGISKAPVTPENSRNWEWRKEERNGQQSSKSVLLAAWADEECLGCMRHRDPVQKDIIRGGGGILFLGL